ncbi:MAG: signal peptidase I [Vulcanimicrobiaceae bacterium]
MTPLELFGIICALIVLRIAMSVRPVSVAGGGEIQTSGDALVPSAPRSGSPLSAVVKEYLDAFIVAGLVALFLITFVVRTFYIPSGSMEPTLEINDVLLVNEFQYRFWPPHDGDVVVFQPPIPTPNDFIKRMIAGPGQTLRIQNGIVYRDGVALDEPYIAQKPAYALTIKNYDIYVGGQPLDPTQANIPPRSDWTAPDRIPKGCYFMMGDNRNDSEDSHIWGFAQEHGTFWSGPLRGQKASFTGRAFLIFWPPGRIHTL